MTPAKAAKAAEELWRSGSTERARLNRLVRYSRGRQRLPWLPDNVEAEYRDLALKSATNWLDLVLKATTQGLFVDGYGTEDGPSPLWETAWQANGMDSRQQALHRAVRVLGYSGLIVFPTDDGGVWMRPEAANKLVFRYDDPTDDWPAEVVRYVSKTRFELYTAEGRYIIDQPKGGRRVVTFAASRVEVCPVVRLVASEDILGDHPQGDVEGSISVQDRIVDATFTLQMVAKYGAFPQRWIAGIDTSKPLTDDDGNVLTDAAGNPLFPTIKAYVDHILTAVDNDTKFGQFAAADLTQYVEALEAHIRHLAAITQTPPHYLLGSLVNLSAEALAAAEAGLMRKVGEQQQVLGEGYEQALGLAGLMLGTQTAEQSAIAQVRWKDVESRSLAQTADAVGKLHALGVPPEVLLKMLPGFSQADVNEALKLMRSGGGLAEMLGQIAGTGNDEAAAIRAKADALGVLIRAGVDPADAAARVGLDGVEFTGAIPTSLRPVASDAAALEQP